MPACLHFKKGAKLKAPGLNLSLAGYIAFSKFAQKKQPAGRKWNEI